MCSVVFSGVQPSGMLHLGNYLGALKQLVDLQHKYKSFFCIVDLHAITSSKSLAKELEINTLKTAAVSIACGIDPKKSVIFNQSRISAHTELAWILSCYTPTSWLNRMTQFKNKLPHSSNKRVSLGLYSYPVLMASDILLYRAKYVPVGDDQKQHLELTRDIAIAFNNHYKINFFVAPEILISNCTSRIMSLRDGTSKMSKSDLSKYSRISFDDVDDLIAKKIERAKTDSILGFDFSTLEYRPEVNNLINIYSILSSLDVKKVCERVNEYDMEKFKKELSDLIISFISPIRKKMRDLLKNQSYLYEILKKGTEKAEEIASFNIKRIKDIVGFI